MTFNQIKDGDSATATTAMQNWTHLNYGNHLLPVDSAGAGVDETIDLGSEDYKFRKFYVKEVHSDFSTGFTVIAHISTGAFSLGHGNKIYFKIPINTSLFNKFFVGLPDRTAALASTSLSSSLKAELYVRAYAHSENNLNYCVVEFYHTGTSSVYVSLDSFTETIWAFKQPDTISSYTTSL